MEVNETAVKAFTGEFITSHPTLQTNMFSRDAAPLCHVVQPYDHHSNAMFADFSMTSAHADYHALLDHELDNLFQHPVEYTMGRADLTFENDTTNLQYNPLQILSPESSSSSHAAFEQVDRRDHYDQPTPGQQSSSGSLRRVQNGSQKRARRLKASVTASKPRAPKIKFTAEEDAKLIELKEMHSLTWNQIAEFFPVRTSGTLQVRYCTKLRAKSTPWSDENIQKLRNAIEEYEADRWRFIATQVGYGKSAVACKEIAVQLGIAAASDTSVTAEHVSAASALRPEGT